jgi:tRNA-2-methylthio-N6-dimethylallyladenosine synthase
MRIIVFSFIYYDRSTRLMKKQLFIQTFGCQMNVHDSEQIVQLMGRWGYQSVDDARDASLVILNTCSIREKAAQKIMSQLGRYRALKMMNPGVIIGVGGCLAQHMGKTLLERVPHLDLVFGTHNIYRLPKLVEAIEKTGNRMVETSLSAAIPSLDPIAAPPKGKISAFVTIMQGCNNYCAYCVVPYLRGHEESRPIHDVINEIRMLADHGVKEVTLLGQNVNSYGHTLTDDVSFPKLLKRVNDIGGIKRIRFTTSHPKDLSDELIRCFKDVPAVCEHIHLPFQSGSDKVLRRMNRGYTRTAYMKNIDKLRASCPEIAITSDVIVGFPGEAEEDFNLTLDMMDKIRFDNLFSFKYSEREGTAAVLFDTKVSEEIKAERLKILQSLQDAHTLHKNQAMEGRIVDVLVEGRSKNNPDDRSGRTRTNKIVNFHASEESIGHSVSVKIKKGFLHSLRGEFNE